MRNEYHRIAARPHSYEHENRVRSPRRSGSMGAKPSPTPSIHVRSVALAPASPPTSSRSTTVPPTGAAPNGFL